MHSIVARTFFSRIPIAVQVRHWRESCLINRHSWKCVDLAIKTEQEKEKDRLRGQEINEERDGERECPTYAVSNYNGYNGIICLRIVAAKHCYTMKCSTINVHRAHSYILLPSSNMYSPCGLKRIVHSLNSACRCIYTHTHMHAHTQTHIHNKRAPAWIVCRQTLHLSISRGTNCYVACIRFWKWN